MIFHIAIKDLKITFKDRKAIMLMLLMPILIILILGSAFSNSFSKEVSVGKFTIGVVNKDNGFLSQPFIEEVLKKGGADMFNTTVINESEVKGMLDKKKAASIITIPSDFTKSIETNKPVKIKVESLEDNKIKAKIVESITESYTSSISLGYAGAFSVIEEAKRLKFPLPESSNGISQATMVMSELKDKISSNTIDFVVNEQNKNKTASAIQYYSAGMLLMFILFGANQGIKQLIEERETKTLSRMITSKAGRIEIIAGKFLGLFIICLVQALILICFTSFIYRVYWGPVLGVALVTVCSVFAGAALGMFIGAISKTSKSADGFSQIFIQLFTILGGGMVPVYIMPKFMKLISNITINWWGMKGYLDLMSGSTAVIAYCGILVLMGLIYLSVGIKRFKVE